MLGDTGVAVNPEDERYKPLVGKHVILPIVGRRIPIVADDYPDPTAGTGAVKMTPAHDFNDFDVGKRTGLRVVNILNGRCADHDQGQRGFPGRPADAGSAARRLGTNSKARIASRRARSSSHSSKRVACSTRSSRNAHGPAWRPWRRSDRAAPDGAMVGRRQDARQPGDRVGSRRPHQVRSEELGKDLFRVDGKHPALVHLAPALVGPSDPGLVRSGWSVSSSRRRKRKRCRRRSSTICPTKA